VKLTDATTRKTPIADPEPLGQRGWLTRWPDESAAAAWAEFANRQKWPVPVEIVPAYRSVALIVVEGPGYIPHGRNAQTVLGQATRESIARFASPKRKSLGGRQIGKTVMDVPVVYDGPDLEEVAAMLELEPQKVVELHGSIEYQVFAVGFLPGFPYAGYLPEKLAGLPRRGSPRTRVPAGSVAIAGRQTGIYPCDSPGGWHILGHTVLEICDLERGFFRFRPTDRIRFVAMPGGILPENPQGPARTSTESRG